VTKAVERLRALDAERRRLEDEVQSLRSRLAAGDGAGAAREARRAEIVAALRRTVAGLRGESA
jgi:hypothetical protein